MRASILKKYMDFPRQKWSTFINNKRRFDVHLFRKRHCFRRSLCRFFFDFLRSIFNTFFPPRQELVELNFTVVIFIDFHKHLFLFLYRKIHPECSNKFSDFCAVQGTTFIIIKLIKYSTNVFVFNYSCRISHFSRCVSSSNELFDVLVQN